MGIIGDIANRKQVMAPVIFHRVTVENLAKSKAAGHCVMDDVDLVEVISPYSEGKNTVKHKVSVWWSLLDNEVRLGKIQPEWVDKYRMTYERWCKGQEPSLDGVPIKGWGVISPAQQETLIRMHILTVEDLANINDEGMRAIGMGGLALMNKARAWIAQLQDKGPLTQEIAAVKAENAVLHGSVQSLELQVAALTNLVKVGPGAAPSPTIEVQDILDEVPTSEPMTVPKRPRGNPNWIKGKEKAE